MPLRSKSKVYSHIRNIADQLKAVGIPVQLNTYFIPQNSIVMGLNKSRSKLEIGVPELPRSKEEKKHFAEAFESLHIEILDSCSKKNQVLLLVHEQPRTFTKPVEIYTIENCRPDEFDFVDNFPIAFRDLDQDGEVIDLDYKVNNIHQDDNGRWAADVSVTAPEMLNYFFIGKDEKRLFISCLPKAVNSLNKVDDVLMPNAVKKALKEKRDVKRQGEFYFVPLKENESVKMLKKVAYSDIFKEVGISKKVNQWDYDESDHTAQLCFVLSETEEYVIGRISNARHDDLVLTSVHRVYCNLEVPAPDNAQWD